MLFAFRIWFIELNVIRFIYNLFNVVINTLYNDVFKTRFLKKNQHGPHNITLTIFCIENNISKLFNMTKFGSGDFMRTYPNIKMIHSNSWIFQKICIPRTFRRNLFRIFTWVITSSYIFLIKGKTRKYLYVHQHFFFLTTLRFYSIRGPK